MQLLMTPTRGTFDCDPPDSDLARLAEHVLMRISASIATHSSNGA